MAKYRNHRNEIETQEIEELEQEQQIMNTPAANVEDEGFKKRYGDLRRFQAQKEQEAKARIDELERKLDQALRGQIKAPKSEEDVEAWASQYPEFNGILETILSKRIKEATSTTEQKLQEIERERSEINAEKAVFELRKKHPDFDQLAKSPEFHDWLKEQDKSAQDAIYSGFNVKAADLVIKAYKADNKISSKSKVDDDDGFTGREAAKVVRTRSNVESPDNDAGDYEFTESQIDNESRKNRNWYSTNEPKILDAMRRGKVLFDLSGGAR